MFNKLDIQTSLRVMGIDPEGTLLVHSSMKALGSVDGGAETVLDAFIEYMADGLLIFPTHTWETINEKRNVYDPKTEPSCVGILGNLFLKRPGVVRSLHPTHSVAALGKEAEAYIKGEENCRTACPRGGCWGKLYDRRAQILFLGCSPRKNTYIHGVEEWYDIPNRLSKDLQPLKIKMPDGSLLDCPVHRHESPIEDISFNYDKIQPALLALGISVKGIIGQAPSILCSAAPMADLVGQFLLKDPDLFIDDKPVPENWYLS